MSKDNNSVVKSAPIDPTPEMIAAGHEIINHRNFSPLLKRKLQARGLGLRSIKR